jgi:branched-chain amino acid transport system ATP-binding protein
LVDVLVVDNVCKSFGKMRAVDNVSFAVREKEVYGIAGPNGAGKSTLFNTISGIPYHSDSGHIYFNGEAIQGVQPHVICHKGIARTFQQETVFDTMTVFENVLVGSVYGHQSNKNGTDEEMAVNVLEMVGLADRRDEKARHLPLFDKKRLMLASALVTQPSLLLLDEPAAGLNRIETQQTLELIQSINGRGITIILIEHVLSLLLAVSHRIMILCQGSKLVESIPTEIVKDERVIEAYLGKRSSHDPSAA